MKILPQDNVLIRVEDVITELNRDPQPGDAGHVDDHARLSQVMFDVPQTTVGLGVAAKDPEAGWFLHTSTDFESEPQPTTFSEVREYVERVGVVAVASGPHAAADGVTDWTEDSEALDGVAFYLFASGVVGLSHAVGDLIQQVTALKAAQA